ncbi:MAG: trigger factor [Dysgonamonadaceae bacterium]|jgi:trigger factor|nr:trigger factor [Dysgonamonadaceae bacterium]
MNITLNKIDPVNVTITVDVAKEDYANEVEKNIKNLRKNAVVPGFRKGMVPLSRIQQIYGKSVLVEEVNKLVADKLDAYIKEEKLNILGEPLLTDDEQKALDFNKQEDFSFTFDIGLAPQIDIKLSKEDKLPYYLIEVTDDMIDKQIENFKTGYGTYEEAETIEGKDLAKGVLTELDENGEPKADGIINESAIMMPSYITSEEEKAKFMGTKTNTTIVFNPYKAYDGNSAELSSLLKIKKDEVSNYTSDFSFEIKEITRYKEAEINQELFDKLFEPGTVTTEEAFREKIKEIVSQQMIPDSDYKFLIDLRKYLEEKTGELVFPEAFLKRWLLASSTERTPESLEKDFPGILNDLKYHLIKEQLIKDYKINVDEVDIRETAKQTIRMQFAQYGMNNVSDQLLENYMHNMLKKEDSVRHLIDQSVEKKLTGLFKEELTLETKTVTTEEFQKLFEEEQQQN